MPSARKSVSLLPFGGMKQSGTARTHGAEEVLRFAQMRSYAIGGAPLPFDVATIMRSPGNYRLGTIILHTMFGVTPRQKMKPLLEGIESLELTKFSKLVNSPRKTAVAVAGLLGVVAAVLMAARRRV
jgi:hypothetical protein